MVSIVVGKCQRYFETNDAKSLKASQGQAPHHAVMLNVHNDNDTHSRLYTKGAKLEAPQQIAQMDTRV